MARLAWVRGRQYRMAWKMGSRDDTEKKVPHRKVIGRMTRLLKVAMLWWDLAIIAAIRPSMENVTHDIITMSTSNGLRDSSGARNRPRAYMMKQLIRPRINPKVLFPRMMAVRLRGHSIISSKLL
jgi:hypothetical protein